MNDDKTIDYIKESSVYDLDQAVLLTMQRRHLRPTQELARYTKLRHIEDKETYYGPSWTHQEPKRTAQLFAGYDTNGFWDALNSGPVSSAIVVLEEYIPQGLNRLILTPDCLRMDAVQKDCFGYPKFFEEIVDELQAYSKGDQGITLKTSFPESLTVIADNLKPDHIEHYLNLALALYIDLALHDPSIPDVGNMEPI